MSKAEDYCAIQELTARYNQTFDTGDLEGWLDCFTEDILFILGGKELGRGLEGMRKFGAEMQGKLRVRHLTTDAIIRVTGDTATQNVYLLLVDISAGSVFKTSGCYADELRKTRGAWKFSKRVATLDGNL